jgi:hypothetical protein
MLKNLFHENVDHGVGFLASANLATAGIIGFLDGLEPALRAILLAGQIAVAGATVLYVYRKAKAVRVPRKYARKKKEPVAPPL